MSLVETKTALKIGFEPKTSLKVVHVNFWFCRINVFWSGFLKPIHFTGFGLIFFQSSKPSPAIENFEESTQADSMFFLLYTKHVPIV